MGSPEILYTQTHKTESVSCTFIFVYEHIYTSKYNTQRNRGYEFERERTCEGWWDKVWEGVEGGRRKGKIKERGEKRKVLLFSPKSNGGICFLSVSFPSPH